MKKLFSMLALPLVLLFSAGTAFAADALVPLAKDCSQSQHPAHTGFQVAPACVSTSMGEVAAADKDPSLLIVEAPDKVKPGQSFALGISTRNLVRDRFLAAGQGGYYLESALLNDAGLTRGHFHVACRKLVDQGKSAPSNPQDVPAFFKAVEDGGGGAAADTVRITVPGTNGLGLNTFNKKDQVQCTAWAGDGSHRTPMMQRANQTPAFDSVRIKVKGEGDEDEQ
jgi:hypothetical protein